MENSGNASLIELAHLMKEYIAGHITGDQYARSYFQLTKKRHFIPSESVNRVTQEAYGDADNFETDPTLRESNSRWIDESELKKRVTESLRQLEGRV